MVSDVQETLTELSHRRLREIAGPDHEWYSLRRLHSDLPLNKIGKPIISYETVRLIHQGEHSGNISDETADALALMWRVDVDEVLRAAGQRPRLGDFELPRRAQRLTAKERRIVLSVIDAILDATEDEDSAEVGAGPIAIAARGDKDPKRQRKGPREQKPD